jgi:hypothetical protein
MNTSESRQYKSPSTTEYKFIKKRKKKESPKSEEKNKIIDFNKKLSEKNKDFKPPGKKFSKEILDDNFKPPGEPELIQPGRPEIKRTPIEPTDTLERRPPAMKVTGKIKNITDELFEQTANEKRPQQGHDMLKEKQKTMRHIETRIDEAKKLEEELDLSKKLPEGFKEVSQTKIKKLRETMNELQVPEKLYSRIFKNAYNTLEKEKSFDEKHLKELVEEEIQKTYLMGNIEKIDKKPSLKEDTFRTKSIDLLRKNGLSKQDISMIINNEKINESFSSNDIPTILKTIALSMKDFEQAVLKIKKEETDKIKAETKKKPWYKKIFRRKSTRKKEIAEVEKTVTNSDEYKKLATLKSAYKIIKEDLTPKY